MICRIVLGVALICHILGMQAQSNPAYLIYNSKGKKVSYKKMVKKLSKADVILFGEYHNNPISHWLQLEVTQDLGQKRKLTLGAEMFEADDQTTLDRYLAGEIDEVDLKEMARVWPNYDTDYSPLVEYAKSNNLRFIATNIPRKYAKAIYREGMQALDSIDAEERKWLTPLPFEIDFSLSQYQKMLEMMGDHGSGQIVMAQASKDATMAHFILKNFQRGDLFIHFNGAYHSDFYQGILWYAQNSQPDLNYKTISIANQETIRKLDKDYMGSADFIICVPENMTKTYRSP